MKLYTVTVPQTQCPVCNFSLTVGDHLVMRVVATFPYAFDGEYVHERCAPPSGRDGSWHDGERGA